MKKFKYFISIFLSLIIILSSIPAYAADYGLYSSDTVSYPTSNLPSLVNLTQYSSLKTLLYNSYDSTFYFVTADPVYSSSSVSGLFVSGSVLKILRSYYIKYEVYSCVAGASSWSVVSESSNINSSPTVCTLSTTDKFKFLYTNSNFTYQQDSANSWTVTNNTSYIGQSGYIYADFFNLQGVFQNNDVYNPGSGSGGSGSGSGSGSVDLSGIETQLTSIFNKLHSMNSSLSSIYTILSNHMLSIKNSVVSIASDSTNIKNNVSSIASSLSSYFTDVSSYLSDIRRAVMTVSNNGVVNYNQTLLMYVNDIKGAFDLAFNQNTGYVWDYWSDTLQYLFYDDDDGLIPNINARADEICNVILYGNKQGTNNLISQQNQLAQFESNLNGLNTNIASAATYIDSAGDGVVNYISTFTVFWNGLTALTGIAAVLSFALVLIFIKKFIGR